MPDPGRRKQYVEVLATHRVDGTVRPRTIVLSGGPSYEIEEVRSVCRARTHSSREVALRYTVRVNGQETFLFDDDGRWFVEMKNR